MVRIDAKDQVPGKVPAVERRGRQVIEQHEVGGGSDAQCAELREIGAERAEDGLHNAGVVLEGQIQHQVGWHDAWVSGRQFVHEIGSLHLLHHVHTEAIVAKTDIDARAHHLFNGRTANGVVHVRARVVDAIGMRFRQAANFAAIDLVYELGRYNLFGEFDEDGVLRRYHITVAELAGRNISVKRDLDVSKW